MISQTERKYLQNLPKFTKQSKNQEKLPYKIEKQTVWMFAIGVMEDILEGETKSITKMYSFYLIKMYLI